MIEANIEALARRYPKEAGALKGVQIHVSGLSVEKAENGRPYLRLKNHTIDAAIEDPRDPSGEARRKIASLSPETKLLVIKGAGLGYLWKAAQAAKNIERIVCIEPQVALFGLMLSVTDMRRFFDDPRVDLYVGTDAGEAIKGIKGRFDYGAEKGKLLIVLPRHSMIRHPVMTASEKFDAEFDTEFSGLVVTSERNRATLDRFVDVWRGHIIENLPAVLQSGSIGQLAGCAQRMPGILVGAGPSLDRNVELLRRVAGRGVIVAVDTAYRTLKSAGIIPNFVVSIDATEENTADFKDVEVGDDATSLVMVPVVHPEIPRLFSRRFVAGYGHPLQKWIEAALGIEFGSLLVSGSVGTIGYDFLRLLKADPIILVGMDFAYGSRTHTRGSMHHEVEQQSRFGSRERVAFTEASIATLSRPGWGGKPVRTTEQMMRWAQWFERELLRGDEKTINATEGGIRIEGATELPLDKAIEQYCRRPFRAPDPVPINQSEKLRKLMKNMTDGEVDKILSWERAVRSPEQMVKVKEEFITGMVR